MDIWGCNEIADVLDDSLLIAHLEKKRNKMWKSNNPPSLTQWKNQMIYYLIIEIAWVTEKNELVQFKAMWQTIMQAPRMGV